LLGYGVDCGGSVAKKAAGGVSVEDILKEAGSGIRNLQEIAEIDVSEKVFANGPNMLVLCLTVIGLIKIYTRFEKITTLADNFLAFISLGYLAATVIAYMALRTRDSRARLKLSRFADVTFLVSLGLTAAVALFMTFALEG
jgi:hypothetical protein